MTFFDLDLEALLPGASCSLGVPSALEVVRVVVRADFRMVEGFASGLDAFSFGVSSFLLLEARGNSSMVDVQRFLGGVRGC